MQNVPLQDSENLDLENGLPNDPEATEPSFALPQQANNNASPINREYIRPHTSLLGASLASLCCVIVSLSLLLPGSLILSGNAAGAVGAGTALLALGSCFGFYSCMYLIGTIRIMDLEIRGQNQNQVVPILPEPQPARLDLANYLMSSPYDHKLEATELLNTLPQLDSKTIISSANFFYQPASDLNAVKNMLSGIGIEDPQSTTIANQIQTYAKNMITPNYNQMGKIEKAETSQALFFGFITALTKNPNYFSAETASSEDSIDNELLEKLRAIPQKEKDAVVQDFNRHLAHLNTALESDPTGTLIVRKIGEFLELLNNNTQTREQESQKVELESNEASVLETNKNDYELDLEIGSSPRTKPKGYLTLSKVDPENDIPVDNSETSYKR